MFLVLGQLFTHHLVTKHMKCKRQSTSEATRHYRVFALLGHSTSGEWHDTATYYKAQVQEEKTTVRSLTLWTWWIAEKGNPAFWLVQISQTDDCWYKQKTILSCRKLYTDSRVHMNHQLQLKKIRYLFSSLKFCHMWQIYIHLGTNKHRHKIKLINIYVSNLVKIDFEVKFSCTCLKFQQLSVKET